MSVHPIARSGSETVRPPHDNYCLIKMSRRQPKQLEFTLKTWGGKRKGAGRKPKNGKAGVTHQARPAFASHHPVHVTMKVRRDVVGSLRRKSMFRCLHDAFVRGCQRNGFHVTDWSVQCDHIHAIVEGKNSESLSRGIQGLTIRLARNLNKALGRTGPVFADRYHMRALRTPREVRNCLAYVLGNARRHGTPLSPTYVDAFSSAAYFDGWRQKPQVGTIVPRGGRKPVADPTTWLRRTGWRRKGLLDPTATPGSRRSRGFRDA